MVPSDDAELLENLLQVFAGEFFNEIGDERSSCPRATSTAIGRKSDFVWNRPCAGRDQPPRAFSEDMNRRLWRRLAEESPEFSLWNKS
jgi:hypothetical protein